MVSEDKLGYIERKNWSKLALNSFSYYRTIKVVHAKDLTNRLRAAHNYVFTIPTHFFSFMGFSFPKSRQWACWLIRQPERHTHQNRLLDSETKHLFGYFASNNLQTQYKLCNPSLQVAARVEFCTKSCEVCSAVYHVWGSVEYQNLSLLSVKTFCNIRNTN